MPDLQSALALRIPRSQTALLQLLQLLVVHGSRWWCGGEVVPGKAAAFAAKLAARYPVLRTDRGRAYDRKKGLAAVHFVFYPMPSGKLAWWLLSTEGLGGLADPSSPDAHIARHAMAADGHLTYADYLLHYATKRERRTLTDDKTGKPVTFDKNTSTWTWRMSDRAYNEVKAMLEQAAGEFQYGSEEEGSLSGVRGILACQRKRPLFAGVRNQVVELHRYAADVWGRVRPVWRAQHGQAVEREGTAAGTLRPVGEVMTTQLPKMRRLPVYGPSPTTLATLVTRPDKLL